MRTIWRVTATGLVPTDADAWAVLHAHKMGSEVMAEPKGDGNPKQLRMWWALCTLVASNFDVTKESISDDVKKSLGHTITVKHWNGEIEIKPASISPEKLPPPQFNALLTLAIEKMAEWMGSAPADLRKRFDEITADRRYDGMMR